MNYIQVVVLSLLTLLGVAHSIMGEIRIFRNVQQSSLGRYRGIIRASWHLLSLFGFALCFLLFQVYSNGLAIKALNAVLIALMLVSSALVGFLTRAKHPAWGVFLVIGVLLIFA
ncbi:MAG: hypothetical protein JXQ90_19335 [Cyclobacteriaceae bacterium]